MYAELRVYTVNRGKMDEWVRWFDDRIRPLAKHAGHTILGPWLNEKRTDFVWIRVYESADDKKAKDERFYGSPAWKAMAIEAASFIAKSDITVLIDAAAPPKAT